MTNDRKLAIKNLKGNDEQLRVTWMLKMKRNKTYKYFSKVIIKRKITIREFKKLY